MQFAPLNVPLHRRGQTFAVLFLFSSLLFAPIFTWLLPVYMLFTSFWPLVLAYAIWFVLDLPSSRRGAYRKEWFMRLGIHRWYAEYFPVKLHKTVTLEPENNYLIGYHPHGIYSLGAFINFSTNGTGLLELFPKVKFHLCTLVGQFYTPLRREWALLHGLIDCSRESLYHVLGSEKKGNVCVLVVGGANEALDAHPGMNDLTLKSRKGFIKVALETGAHLVPSYSFGENELFEQVENPKGSRLRAFQTWVKKYIGMPPVMFHGRGVFNYTFGMLPYRHPVNTVIGRPISVERVKNPDKKTVDDLHAKYVEALTELFEDNKEKYGLPKDAKLNIA